jgi:hypothetical protein
MIEDCQASEQWIGHLCRGGLFWGAHQVAAADPVDIDPHEAGSFARGPNVAQWCLYRSHFRRRMSHLVRMTNDEHAPTIASVIHLERDSRFEHSRNQLRSRVGPEHDLIVEHPVEDRKNYGVVGDLHSDSTERVGPKQIDAFIAS